MGRCDARLNVRETRPGRVPGESPRTVVGLASDARAAPLMAALDLIRGTDPPPPRRDVEIGRENTNRDSFPISLTVIFEGGQTSNLYGTANPTAC